MVKLRGKNSRNIPRIYDIRSSEINGAEVNYLFYEYLEGENLDLLVSRGDEIDLFKLSEGIFGALKSIHSNGYWFADFCEKNIYRDLGGRFILLDLDSCISLSVPPRTDALGNKDYWSPVFHFYRDLLGYRSIKTEDLPGNFLNLLQLYLMVFRIHKFYGLPKDQRNYSGLLNKLHLMLLDAIPRSKELFLEIFPTYDPAEYKYITGEIFSTHIVRIIDRDKDKVVLSVSEIESLPGNENLIPEESRFTDPKPQIISSNDAIVADYITAESATLKNEHTLQKIWDPVPVSLPETVQADAISPEEENIDKDKRKEIAKEQDNVIKEKEVEAAIIPSVVAIEVTLNESPAKLADAPVIETPKNFLIKAESVNPVKSQYISPLTTSTATRSNGLRLLLVFGITAIALITGLFTYLQFKKNSRSGHDQEVEKLKALSLERQKASKMVAVAYSPDTLTLVAKQFEAVNISVAAAIISISDLSVSVAGKPIPPNLISLKPGRNSSLVTIFIDSAYQSGEIILNYPGLTIESNILTIIKIKTRQPRHFHAPILVNVDEEKRLHDAEVSKRDDSLKRIQVPEKESVQRTFKVGYQANYFELNRDEGLMHKIFAKKQYLIHGHGFLNAKNGFEVFDLHDRLPVKIENDSILIVKSPRKVHALLLKLLPRGSADTLWVRAK